MVNFKQIDEARKLLGLDEIATLKEIKDAYRRLSLKYHPDRCKKSNKKFCEQAFKKITWARDIILNYCAGYKYSFKEEDVEINIIDIDKQLYEHFKRFYEDWL